MTMGMALLNAPIAAACARPLVAYAELCAIADRYEAALTRLESQGIDRAQASRIADAIAPRFINDPQWIKGRESAHYDPFYFYAPAPITWVNWLRGKEAIDARIAAARQTGELPRFTEEFFTSQHALALAGLLRFATAGVVRTEPNYGVALSRRDALRADEIATAIHNENVLPGAPELLHWQPTLCFEDHPVYLQMRLSIGFQSEFYILIPPEKFFDGVHQCGWFEYPAADVVPRELKRIASYVDESFAAWNAVARASAPAESRDPMDVATRAQRWFVLTHPFPDGNGRVSRYVGDYILQSLGLPAPIVSDMMQDYVVPLASWRAEMLAGVRRALEVYERCAAEPKASGCLVTRALPVASKP